MTSDEVNMMWLYLAGHWRNYAVPSTEVEMLATERAWLSLLEPFSADEVEAVITGMASEGREFAPTPGEIRRVLDQATLQARGLDAPDPDEAWAEVRSTAKRGGITHPQWSHEAIADAVKALGWREYRNSMEADEGIWRAHFLRFYETAVKRSRATAGIGLAPVVTELAQKFAVDREVERFSNELNKGDA